VYCEVSRFPPVIRDVSVTVPEEIRVQDVLEDLMAHRPPSVEAIRLFDHYRGAGIESGKKSLAFRVLLQDTQKTMTDAEVDAAVQQVRQRLQERFGGEFRQ
jgi:phenylalanyl-tRNA synthetase beta chain